MHIATFLQDLAIVMLVAGIVTIIFHLLKQPVVLGYILAGLIIGRHTPPFSFINDEDTIRTLAELGVVFLMFSLGLEFSIKRLLRVGMTALVAAAAEIMFMTMVGYELGCAFGWSPIDSVFLGAMLAISSTTIIIKVLKDLKMKKEYFAQLIFGVLIVEDILAIAILAILSSVAIGNSVHIVDIAATLGKLLVFIVVALISGILIVPNLLAFVARFKSKEILLITVLGLCFGFSLLVTKLGYSIALGAFLIGAIMAESEEIKHIRKIIEPLANMFSAIFFVSIGLLVDPEIIWIYIVPITLITITLVLGKVLICSLSVFLTGKDGRTSMRVGMGLAQIGEFSFIIAALGVSLNMMSDYLYPIIVAVSAITTFLTPYLIKFADPFAGYLAKHIPHSVAQLFDSYTHWLQDMQTNQEPTATKAIVKQHSINIAINLAIIIAIFIVGSYLAHAVSFDFAFMPNPDIEDAAIWGVSLLVSLPFLIAIYFQLKNLSIFLAEITIKPNEAGEYDMQKRRALSEMVPVLAMQGIILMIIALSASILPPIDLLIFLLVVITIITIVLWRWFFNVHSRLQAMFMEKFSKK